MYTRDPKHGYCLSKLTLANSEGIGLHAATGLSRGGQKTGHTYGCSLA